MAPLIEFDEDALPNYSDAELALYIASCPRLCTTREETVRVISPHLISKPVPWPEDPQDEAQALERALAVGVRVPKVHRIVRRDESSFLLVMDRIQGMTVEQLWRDMSIFTTLRVAWQLRGYLRSMMSVVSQTTGGLHSGHVESEWIDTIHKPIPHASPFAFSSYLNWWLTECRPDVCAPRPDLKFPTPPRHVLVHQDLAPRNMILDPQGTLWLVDWGNAGFYPSVMEYMGMEARTHAMEWLCMSTWAAWWGRLRWDLFRWIACGSRGQYTKAIKAMLVVQQRSLRYKLSKPVYSGSY